MEILSILVIDDEPGMRMGTDRVLKNHQIILDDPVGEFELTVRTAGTLAEGLALIHESPPDIIILDYKLPDGVGLDLLQKIQDAKFEVLTIVVTAYASLDVAISATKLGAYDFLAKPFTPTELKNVIYKAVKHLHLQRTTRKLAEEKKRARFQFISILSHELKAPLATLEGYLRLMQDDGLVTDTEKRNKIIERSLYRLEGMRRLIFDLLDMTRIEAGQKQRQLTPLNLGDVAKDCLEAFKHESEVRDVSVDYHQEGPLDLVADRAEMEMILNNLVSNAIKYNRLGGKVIVELKGDEEGIRLKVADTGIGMSEEDQKKLFKEFSRIKNQKTRDILGTGLGLFILKRLVGLYGGEVLLESKEDIGTTFTLTFPVNHEQVPSKTD